MSQALPRIGFDRYIELAWSRSALETACGRSTLDDLNALVGQSLAGAESRRKSVDILKRFWLNPFHDASDFLLRGVEIFKSQGSSAVLPLTWGAAVSTYPFFGMTAEITGRLFRLHNDCAISEVQRRMAETYGDRDGVARAVSRVLQSMENWGAIKRIEKNKRMINLEPVIIDNDVLTAWLIEAVLRYTQKPISMVNIQTLPTLYPFVMVQPLAYVISQSEHLELRSDGSSSQFVVLL